MKKIISAILATLMLFTLAACGEESTPAEATAQTTKATTAEKEIQTTTTADPNAPKEIDVFEFVEVIYSGISPDGTAEINYDEIPDELADNAEFTIDKTEGLKNGDTITLTCIPEESLLVFENIVPTRLTKEVTVDGVAEYITDISKYDLTSINKTNDELVNIQLSYIIKIGEKTLKHNIVEDLGSAEMWTVEDMKINLSEQYFFAKKDEHQGVKVTADNLMRDYNNVENSLISVYKCDITVTKTDETQETFSQLVVVQTLNTTVKSGIIEWQDHFTIYLNRSDALIPPNEDYYETPFTDVDDLYAEYERLYGEDYDVVKIN